MEPFHLHFLSFFCESVLTENGHLYILAKVAEQQSFGTTQNGKRFCLDQVFFEALLEHPLLTSDI